MLRTAMSKPSSPSNESEAASRGGKTPAPGAAAAKGKAAGNATPRSGATPTPTVGAAPGSSRGGAKKGAGGKDSTAAANAAKDAAASAKLPEEFKEPTDEEYLRRLYAEQKEYERVKALEVSHATLMQTCAELHKAIASMEDKHTHLFIYKQRETAKQLEHQKLLDATIADLTAQNESLVATHKAEVALTAQTHLAQIVALEERMSLIQAKYESLHTFKLEKSDLEAQLLKYKQLLEQEKTNHALNVSELERRNVMEKDRLKNEMLRKIRETKLSLLAMTEDQLHTTTKRTIMENDQMTTELQYQSKETERIVRKNSKLTTENTTLKRELDLAAQTQQIMAKKTMFYQSLISKLQAKIDTMNAEREKEKQMFAAQTQQMQAQVALAMQSLPGGGHSKTTDRSSGLNGILRGVEEMNALASSASATATPLSILPRTISGQSSRTLGGGAATPTSHSRASLGGGMTAHPQGSPEDAATISRLHERLASLERERERWMDSQRSLAAQMRETQSARLAAESRIVALETELAELQATLTRVRAHRSATSAQLGESALEFIASCIEDQRLARSGVLEDEASERAAAHAATLAPVQADGTDQTVVVRAPGERGVAGGAAVIAAVASPALSPSDPSAPGAGAGGWDGRGYPASLVSFTPVDRMAILETMLQQLSVFQKSNPPAAAANNASQQTHNERRASQNSSEARPQSRATHTPNSNRSSNSARNEAPQQQQQQQQQQGDRH